MKYFRNNYLPSRPRRSGAYSLTRQHAVPGRQAGTHGVATMTVGLILGLSILTTPVATAGDSEDALEECLSYAVFGGIAAMAGCAAGYVILGATVDGTYPKFDFGGNPGEPWSGPLGRNHISYTLGKRETLTAGLWKGCPPDCMTPPILVPGKEDVESVVYHVVSVDDLGAAKQFEDANWHKLGEPRFNTASSAWELLWDTSGYSEVNGYVLRADFKRRDGKMQTGIGLALMQN